MLHSFQDQCCPQNSANALHTVTVATVSTKLFLIVYYSFVNQNNPNPNPSPKLTER